jgi:hypothetical protein
MKCGNPGFTRKGTVSCDRVDEALTVIERAGLADNMRKTRQK